MIQHKHMAVCINNPLIMIRHSCQMLYLFLYIIWAKNEMNELIFLDVYF